MGWSSGTELYREVIAVLKQNVPDHKTRVEIHKKLIVAFRDCDWDTEDECCGKDIAFDEALNNL